MSGIDRLEFTGAELSNIQQALGREWLLTNGLGGYASSSLLGANTRRYHGLLVAAVNPPVQRTVLLSKVDEEITLGSASYKLGVNEWKDSTIDPQGYYYLEKVSVSPVSVEFRYALPGCQLIKTICMPHGFNAVYLNYRLEGTPPAEQARLVAWPFLACKDYHAEQRGKEDWHWQFKESNGIYSYRANDDCPILSMGGDHDTSWQAEETGYWYWNFYHRAEAERGLDFTEDLYCAHSFQAVLKPDEQVSMVWWLGEPEDRAVLPRTFQQVCDASAERLLTMQTQAGFDKRDQVSRLLFNAADQFIVVRPSVREVLPPDVPDRSVIAGYHWFSDWGRDTMIALPGLFLTTGRYTEAAGLLRTFAAYLNQGMLPNRFPESGEEPEYNTVDATLWLFQAVYTYYQATRDLSLIAELYPKLTEVIDWHQRGTRYGIKADPADGLLHSGEAGVQLTWMDVKIEDWVVTPRTGKPVEINALWCNALGVMEQLALELKRPAQESQHYHELGERARQSFHAKFWYEEGEYLYDVVDSEDPHNPYIDEQKRDCSLRPNQLFALSLPFGPFADLTSQLRERAASVIDVCAKSLLTPYGLRTLSPNDLRYIGRFTGGRKERDEAYHQGTVWPWPVGAFVEAHYRVHGDRVAARAFLEPLCDQLREGSVGSINEVYDGDPPHRPLGCIAQAWSVSEVLRLWVQLSS
jgi:predicted glycogen debranching enzyme